MTLCQEPACKATRELCIELLQEDIALLKALVLASKGENRGGVQGGPPPWYNSKWGAEHPLPVSYSEVKGDALQ
jgi:hypothetical protein